MRKIFSKFSMMLSVFVMVGVAILAPSTIYASTYENDETGYEAIIVDEAGLLSSSEKADLLEEMEALTEYTNIAFVSVEENRYSTENLAMRLNEEYFGNESGIVFIIDMDNRYIWIDSMGSVRKVITEDYAQTITDNVYSYASDENYYKCAS
ncbi:MAG: TPM domain-containing protein, partial [Agathobacter sp.]